MIAHDYRTLLKYKEVFPGARVIEFKNFSKFRVKAALLKDPRPSHVNDDDYRLGETYYFSDQDFFQLESYMIDVDGTFFDWDKFNPMMADLYNYLGFDDYQPELVKQFYTRYIELHQE